MKLLFLDIDGVLNDHAKLESGYCGIRHDKASLLNRILDAVPDVQLVISSAWRYLTFRGDMTVKGFEYLLLVHGVKCFGRVHGTTAPDGAIENEPNHHDPEAWRTAGLKWRANQIRDYLSAHGVDSYAVLDDLPIAVDRLMQTDGATGLTDADVAKVIALLTP